MHIAYLTTLVEELEARQIPAAALIDPVPSAISDDEFADLFEKAVSLAGDPGFGLSFGMRLNLASHGVLGYALMSSRNGQQLISALTRFAGLALPSIELTTNVAGDQLRVTCRSRNSKIDALLYMEVVLATLVSGARAMFNRKIPGACIWLNYPPPPHAAAYDVLRLPVHFNKPECALVCKREFLEMDLPGSNPVLAEIGQRQCFELLRGMRDRQGFANRVRTELVSANGEFPTLETMATKLIVSGRTLRRRLADEGTSYREIMDEVRFELARQYLATGVLPITEVAGLLGYEDPANFRRAFRRWSGMTAQAWQKSA